MKRKVFFTLCLFCVALIKAQDSSLGNWMIYIGHKQLNRSWNIHHEVQYRNYNAIGDLEQLLLRSGLGYNLSPENNNILLGYGFINSQNYISEDTIILHNTSTKNSVFEHRIYQQFITKQKLGALFVQHRYRFEERFFQGNFKIRFRYFLALNLPLTKEKKEKENFYLSAYNEIFIQPGEIVFDRNRLYAGLGLKLNEKIKLEMGYMNQFLENKKRNQINLFCFYTF